MSTKSSGLQQSPKKQNTPLFQQDFICISEFCEQQGPIPIFTIPQKGEGKFDLNSFVVRIQASDHTRKVDRGDHGSFCRAEDTQVYLADQGAFAYVCRSMDLLLNVIFRSIMLRCMIYMLEDM